MLTQQQVVFLKEQIQYKARNLKAKSVFRSEEVEDIEQELWARLLAALANYDPQRGDFNHFAMKVLKNQGIKMLAKQCCLKRGIEFTQVPYETALKIADSTNEDTELNRLAIQDFLKKLPIHIRSILHKIPLDSLRGIARRYEISRATLRKVMHALRDPLSQALGELDFLVVRRFLCWSR